MRSRSTPPTQVGLNEATARHVSARHVVGVQLLLLAVTVALEAFVAEGQNTPAAPRACGTSVAAARLMDTFYSCATGEGVRKMVVSRGLQSEVMRDGPPMNPQLSLIRVVGFAHLGAAGELRLLFFRDRLMQILFFPPDVQDYWQRLVRAESLKVTATGHNIPSMTAQVGERVAVSLRTDKDPHERWVAWQDMLLVKEYGYEVD